MSFKRLIPALVLLLGALYLASPLLRPTKSDFNLDGFGRIPVVANGRTKPLDSVARNTLLLLQGRQRVVTPDGTSLTPSAWLLDVFFRPDRADTYQHFEIVNPGLLDVFGLKIEDGDGKKRFSYRQLTPKLEELDRQAGLAEGVESAVRTPYQRAVVNLRNHVIFYQQLKHSVVMPDGSDFLAELLRLQDNLEAGIEAVRSRETGKSTNPELASFVMQMGSKFLRMDQIGSLLVVPPAAGAADTHWSKAGQALLGTFKNTSVNVHALTFAGLQRTWTQQNAEQFNTLLAKQRAEAESSYADVLKKTDAEVRFNQAEPFYTSMTLYVLAFLLAVFSWLKWPDALQRSAYYLVLLAWVATTTGILLRMWIEGRPPVTNLYSSALFVGWGSVGLCLILEKIFRNGIGSVAAALTGFCTLVIAHHLSLTGDTLEMMRAVLDSNFWLATHVVVITIGYSATYLAGFLAIIYVGRGVFTRSLDQATADSLNRMVYGITCFATLFSLVGTILGGIWADQSWGRFWGWDPKENGALIIVIWNAIILHARWGGLARTRGIMALAIFGNIVTSWSWFGTNMLGVGLHSYGFMDQAFVALVVFVASQLILISMAYIPKAQWRSAALLR
ncbi:MAG: cytochrome c biogenesis protein CcsA [Opitutus sp.]|nr:cytochrome c biogenesis protein CcsA [Opitutus sp.]MCS6246299.1 cytochrome c biogenesis protein CcsA [Opitutus sp.]MCS6273075.1 cytochrome c biogenesis protein CcsA [Opitutus sp.]MCS6277904.1 cytochrome c biogenesis protein CcsA [Opitutus sp.]MCS6298989.1 cytochrome c biogenesis protein CcsA [Opitutus sp.]